MYLFIYNSFIWAAVVLRTSICIGSHDGGAAKGPRWSSVRSHKRTAELLSCEIHNKTKQDNNNKKKTGAYAALALTYTNTNRSFVAPALSYQFKHMSTHAERGGQMESQRGLLAFHTPET